MHLYDLSFLDRNDNSVSLGDFRGKVLLITNTATECGFTPHYGDLERLHKLYVDRGLVILDFPSNGFNQAPGTVEEIHQFCTGRFGVTFWPQAKIEVAGEGAHPLFKYLTERTRFAGFDMSHPIGPKLHAKLSAHNPDYHLSNEVKWNFTKFLIDREGEIIARFEPTFDLAKIESAIIDLL